MLPRGPTAAPGGAVSAFRAALRATMTSRGIAAVAPPPKPAAIPAGGVGPDITLEQLLDLLYEDGASEFPLSTSQRALARACDGNGTAGITWIGPGGVDITADTHAVHFGTSSPIPIAGCPPRTILLRCGIRCGKTYIAAVGTLKAALTCQVRRPLTEAERLQGRRPDADGLVAALQPGEHITVFFATPKMIQSQKAFEYVRGALLLSRLKTLVTTNLAEHISIRRPHDGVTVDFRMEALSPRGSNLRFGWLAAAMIDEAAFVDDSEEAAISLKDNVTACTSRLLPGGQVWEPSSPWADSGSWHDDIEQLMRGLNGRQNGDATALAFHSSSYTLNPALDPNLRIEAAKKDEIEAQREYDATPISALTNLFFTPAALARAVNIHRTPENGYLTLPPIAGIPHYAGVDIGYRKNSSTIVIARNELRNEDAAGTPFQTTDARDVAIIAFHAELIPPKNVPLVPSIVTATFAQHCQEYGCHTMRGDSYDAIGAADHLRNVSGPPVTYDEFIPTLERNTALFTRALERMAEGCVELPADPRLLGQLKRVQKRVEGNAVRIILPKQGRAHADLVVALVHAIVQAADWSSSGSTIEYDTKYDRFLAGMGSDRRGQRGGYGPDDGSGDLDTGHSRGSAGRGGGGRYGGGRQGDRDR